jgi:stalled ribosome alternative rescue factor ArfA
MKGLNFYSDVVAAGMMLLFKLSKGQIQPNEIQILVEKVMFRLIEKTYKKQNTNEAIKNQL